jgi:hypothetical protein
MDRKWFPKLSNDWVLLQIWDIPQCIQNSRIFRHRIHENKNFSFNESKLFNIRKCLNKLLEHFGTLLSNFWIELIFILNLFKPYFTLISEKSNFTLELLRPKDSKLINLNVEFFSREMKIIYAKNALFLVSIAPETITEL